MSLFRAEGLVKRFGGLLATDHVDLAVEAGELHVPAALGEVDPQQRVARLDEALAVHEQAARGRIRAAERASSPS